jgi:L-ascorbate metabolism protein UlaG (beta-lactamase superfamily)
MNRWVRNGLLFLVGLGVVLVVAGLWALSRPDLSPWQDRLTLAPERCPRGDGAPPCVEVSWLGVATLVFDDGETRLLTDGFFSRPSIYALATGGAVAPDADAIEAGLSRAGLDRAAAVMTVHSHYDHAMDSPEVARRLGAVLVGSASTAMVGRGAGLPESQILTVQPGRPMSFGAFRVTFHESRHVPLPGGGGAIGQSLDAPLVPPVPAMDYVEGGSFSIEIAHPAGVALVQGSAGFIEGQLEGIRADSVLLGIGGLAGQEPAYRETYYAELLDRVEARQVVPIHWDDFTEPPGVVVPFPVGFGDVSETFAELEARAEARDGLAMALLPPWETVVLLRGERAGD